MEEQPKKVIGRPFVKGQIANPKGRGSKKPITRIYEELLEDPANVELVKRAIVKALRDGRMAAILVLREMTERIEGKVAAKLELEVSSLGARMDAAQDRLAQKRQELLEEGSGEPELEILKLTDGGDETTH